MPGKKKTSLMLRVAEKTGEQADSRTDLGELLREGARRVLVQALEAEVEDYGERYRDERDASGRAHVVRTGKARPRKVTTG